MLSNAMMLAGFLTSTAKDLMSTDDNDPFKGDDHQVCHVDMGKNIEELCNSSGDIHLEGLFFFKKLVNEQKNDLEVFQLPIDNKNGGYYVTILQILFIMELVDGMAFQSFGKRHQ